MAGLTDEQMAALEAKHAGGGLTDDELEAKAKPGVPAAPEKSRAERLLAAVQGVTEWNPTVRMAGYVTHPDRARSALMGITSNAAPRALAGLEGIKGALTPGDTFSGAYDKALPDYQKQYSKAAEENPADAVGGAMLQPNPLAKLKGATAAGKAGVALARTGYAAANGGLTDWLGGGSDPGAAAAKSGGIQAALEAGAPLAGKLYNAAGSQYIKAAGFKTGIANKAQRAGIPIFDAAGEESLPKLGNEMADQGLIPFGASKQTVLKRSKSMMDQAGNSQASAIGVMDMKGKPDPVAATQLAQERLAARIDPTKGGNLQTARAAGPAKQFISDIPATVAKQPTFQALQDLKSGAYGATNWSTKAADAPVNKRAAVSGLKEYLEGAADKAGVGDQLRGANKSYGLAAKAADLSEDAAGREAGHSPGWGTAMLGLTAAGGVGAAAHSPALGAGALGSMVALNVAKKHGNAMAAPALRAGSQLAAGGGKLASESPAVSGSLEQWLTKKPDDEREQEGAEYFTKATGGR